MPSIACPYLPVGLAGCEWYIERKECLVLTLHAVLYALETSEEYVKGMVRWRSRRYPTPPGNETYLSAVECEWLRV